MESNPHEGIPKEYLSIVEEFTLIQSDVHKITQITTPHWKYYG